MINTLSVILKSVGIFIIAAPIVIFFMSANGSNPGDGLKSLSMFILIPFTLVAGIPLLIVGSEIAKESKGTDDTTKPTFKSTSVDIGTVLITISAIIGVVFLAYIAWFIWLIVTQN